MLQVLVQSPLFTLVTFIVALVGLGLTIVFYLKSRRFRRITYGSRSFPIVTGQTARIPDLQVLYRNAAIETLTTSTVTIWNSGSETISAGDISSLDLLRIVATGETRILDIQALHSSKQANAVNIVPSETAHILTFDFLDAGDGSVVNVMHTGKTGKDIELVGTIKGRGSITHTEFEPPSWGYPLLGLPFMGIMIFMIWGTSKMAARSGSQALLFVFVALVVSAGFPWAIGRIVESVWEAPKGLRGFTST